MKKPEDLDDGSLYAEYQDAKENGPTLRIDELQLEIAQRWEEQIEDEDRDEPVHQITGAETAQITTKFALDTEGYLAATDVIVVDIPEPNMCEYECSCGVALADYDAAEKHINRMLGRGETVVRAE